MVNLSPEQPAQLQEITPDERQRLLAYCTRVTADVQAAEDLVQQTLLEAWQHASRLYAPEMRMPWLFGIARNVGLRWLRAQGRELSRQVSMERLDDESEMTVESL